MNLLNCFLVFWCFLEKNSGQLQTLAACIGLALAIYALNYSKKQISISQAERLFSLRMQISSEFFSSMEKIEITLNKIRLLREVELKKCLNINNMELNNRIKVLDNSLKVNSESLKLTKASLENFHTSYLDKKTYTSLNELEKILEIQIKIQEKIFKSLNSISRTEIIILLIQRDNKV